MARYDHLPIFKRMMELAIFIENAVRHFSRYHKYTLGSELRTMCHDGLALIGEANATKNRSALLLQLRRLLERIKIHLMLAKEVRAFNKSKTFFSATDLVVDVSRQNEGWLRSCQSGAKKRI